MSSQRSLRAPSLGKGSAQPSWPQNVAAPVLRKLYAWACARERKEAERFTWRGHALLHNMRDGLDVTRRDKLDREYAELYRLAAMEMTSGSDQPCRIMYKSFLVGPRRYKRAARDFFAECRRVDHDFTKAKYPLPVPRDPPDEAVGVANLQEKPDKIEHLQAENNSLRATIESQAKEIQSAKVNMVVLINSNRRREDHIDVLVDALSDGNMHSTNSAEGRNEGQPSDERDISQFFDPDAGERRSSLFD